MRETAVNKRQPGAFTHSARQERVREEDTCALPGQAVKYPCGPLVQRAAQSPALLLSFCSFSLSSHSYPLLFAPLTVRSGCRELVLHFYQSHLRLSNQGELRLSLRAPPLGCFTGAQSRLHYRPANEKCRGACQSIR